jgi:alpha-beta hydrolase superfamily lysophospholipase
MQFLRDNGYTDSQITEYYDILARFRKRFHPDRLAPDPKEHYITATDGTKIFVQEFIPEYPRAIVIGQPGNSCVGDLYYPLADHLYFKDIGLVVVDNRGHGRSGPDRGRFDHPELMFPIYDSILKRFEGLPRHLIGESLGSTMVAAYLANASEMAKKVSSTILLVAPFKMWRQTLFKPLMFEPVFQVLKLLIYIMRAISADRPFLGFKPDFRPTYFHEYHKLDQIDIVRAQKSTAAHLYNLVRMIKSLPGNAMKIKVPVLVMAGTGDQNLDPRGDLEFFRKATRIHRKIHIFKNADHSLMFDKNSQNSYDIVASWLEGDWKGKNS